MTDTEPTPASRPKTAIEHATDALGLLLTAVAVYRFTCPDAPEPLELIRDGYARARDWLTRDSRNRQQLAGDLERIRNLPETEATE